MMMYFSTVKQTATIEFEHLDEAVVERHDLRIGDGGRLFFVRAGSLKVNDRVIQGLLARLVQLRGAILLLGIVIGLALRQDDDKIIDHRDEAVVERLDLRIEDGDRLCCVRDRNLKVGNRVIQGRDAASCVSMGRLPTSLND